MRPVHLSSTVRHWLTITALCAVMVLAFNGGVRMVHLQQHADGSTHDVDCPTCHLIAAGLDAELPPAPTVIAPLQLSPQRVARDGSIVFASTAPIRADARGPPMS